MDTSYHQKIASFYTTHRRMPSYSEIASLLGFRSKNSAYVLVQKLIERGYVNKGPRGKLIPGPLLHEVKVLGTIEAGFPTPAEEELVDTMTLDDWLIENREATYLLSVKGDSMKNAGILARDVVLAERTSSYKPGDIVIAEVDGEWTMKYLRRDTRGKYYLSPANDAYTDIYPKESLEITAVIRGVIRKYA